MCAHVCACVRAEREKQIQRDRDKQRAKLIEREKYLTRKHKTLSHGHSGQVKPLKETEISD